MHWNISNSDPFISALKKEITSILLKISALTKLRTLLFGGKVCMEENDIRTFLYLQITLFLP